MSELHRSQLIGLLQQLGAKDDATVLAAARELHGLVSAAEVSWDELLEPEFVEEDEEDDLEYEDEAGEHEAEDEQEAADDVEAAAPAALDEDAEIIDRLLATKGISAEMREELTELKQEISDGEFTAMDSRYVRALARRLGV